MQAVLTTYFVVASLPVVVEDAVGQTLNYSPGAIFQALSNNPSIVRLIGSGQIIEIVATVPIPGSTVIQGPTGPAGDPALTGWERVGGSQVRLATDTDQVTMGLASPPVDSKVNIDASKGSFFIGLTIVNGPISVPDSGTWSERFGENTIATGACSLAVGEGAQGLGTNSSAGGKGAVSSAAYGTVWGAGGAAGLDGTSLGAGAMSDQGGTALGRAAVATGLRSLSGGFGATVLGADAVLVGANGNISADQTIVVGAAGSATALGAQAAGYNASAGALDATAWGRNAISNFSGSHAFGAGAITTMVNQVVVGSQANPIGFLHIGRGEAATVKQDVRIASTRIGTTQSDEAGSNLTLEAGPGTGNATPSRIFLQTAPAGPSGNSQQVLATQMIVGEGVDVTNWLNVNSTLAVAPGDIAASDGTTTFFWDANTPQLNLGVEGVITRIRGVAATSSGVDGASLLLVGGTGLTTGAGGAARVIGGLAGPSGVGGGASLEGGFGTTGGGIVGVYGGTCVGAMGGGVTVQGGSGTPAGAVLVQGGITNGVGGQSGAGVFSGGDASATQISMAGDGVLKGGDGVSNNNHGAHAYIRGGIAFGAGVHGRVQIDTAGVGRWQVDNAGQLLAVADNTYDVGAIASGRPRDLFVGRNAVIDGHLTVNGGQTIIDTEVQTADRYILLNSEYTANAPLSSGIVCNVDPAATSFAISAIASNVVTVVAGDPSAVLGAGDFVLIQDPANADNVGIREVLSTTVSTITIDPTPAEPFAGTGLTDDATVQGTIVGTSVSVLRTNAVGDWEAAFGAAAPLSFSTVGGGSLADTLLIGNTTGGTDIAITSGDQIGGGRANFGTATDATSDGDFAAGLVGDSRISFTQSTGTLSNIFTNGESSNLQYASAVIDFSVSGTATGLIPAGALPVGVTTRVLTPISGGGATGYNIGDTSDADRWGAGLALAAATQSDPTDYTDNTLSFNASASAADVVLSGVGGAPTAGTVRVTLAYLSLTAPTS